MKDLQKIYLVYQWNTIKYIAYHIHTTTKKSIKTSKSIKIIKWNVNCNKNYDKMKKG